MPQSGSDVRPWRSYITLVGSGIFAVGEGDIAAEQLRLVKLLKEEKI